MMKTTVPASPAGSAGSATRTGTSCEIGSSPSLSTSITKVPDARLHQGHVGLVGLLVLGSVDGAHLDGLLLLVVGPQLDDGTVHGLAGRGLRELDGDVDLPDRSKGRAR